MDNKKIIIICGPTATGKTKLAIALAKKINGELISADSKQIYQGMDIGTGKDLPKNAKFQMINNKPARQSFAQANAGGTISNFPAERDPASRDKFQSPNKKKYKIGYYLIRNRPLWLYDIIQPNQLFSAFEYACLARLVIEDIKKRGKIPIVVGGTGFYIKALIDGINTAGIKADWELREKLRNKDIEELREILKQLNPNKLVAMNNSDRNNSRRLIRAIEIAQSSKFKVQSSKINNNYKSKLKVTNYGIRNSLFVGLTAPKKTLYQRIDARVDKRIKEGIIEEIMSLLKKGYSWNDPGMNALGYKEWEPFFERTATKQDVINRWKLNEHSYARRQLTWFNKDKRIWWFDIINTNHETIVRHVLNTPFS